MTMTHDDAAAFVRERTRGVLATVKSSDGRPQLSNILYAAAGGVARISVTATRAKTRNVVADPRVSLHVTSDDFWTYVVAEGLAELGPVAHEPGDDACRELLELYELLSDGPHPSPAEFAAAMIAEQRQVLRITVERYYPTS